MVYFWKIEGIGVRLMDGGKIRELAGGINQSGVRDHNERLILSLLYRHGAMPGSDVARVSGLSPQTASIILRKLEQDGIVERGAPVRGKVGKPSIPMNLNPEGVLSIGLKLGRRSADLVLLDLVGNVRMQFHTTYEYALPDPVFQFLQDGVEKIMTGLSARQRARVCGIGVGTPFELWKWHTLTGDAARKFHEWKDVDFGAEIARFSDLPVFVVNDATAACHAEHLYGRGSEYRDYFYFYIGSMIGGGVTLNGTVFEGNQGNAGALGAMRIPGPRNEGRQLIDVASLYLLEDQLIAAGLEPGILWKKPQNWQSIAEHVEPWIETTAQEIAKATVSICAVIDFEAIFVDGAFPSDVREEMVSQVRENLAAQDMRGLIRPQVEAGSVGEDARAIGAASSPIFKQFLLDTNAGVAAI